MEQLELGQATIVYEGPDGETTEETVDNEQLVYVRDHWAIKSGTDDQGNDLMKQIPRGRVYSVERNVETFEEEASTVRHRVESIASDIRQKIPMDVGNGHERGRRGPAGGRSGQQSQREQGRPGQSIPVEESEEEE